MNKALLFIPFLALLGTSCGGAHITTTPVMNAPKAGLLQTHPKRSGGVDTTTDTTSAIALDKLNWTYNASYGYISVTAIQGFIYNPSGDYRTLGKMICSRYTTASYSEVTSGTKPMCIACGTNDYPYLVISDLNYNSVTAFTNSLYGLYLYYISDGSVENTHTAFFNEGYEEGYQAGLTDGYYSESNKLIPNGMYTGLTIFPRRKYLEEYAQKIMSGEVNPENGQFYLNDTNANYTIEMQWTYDDTEKITTFKSYGGLVVGKLDWHDVAEGVWNSTWFGKYDAELHHFTDTKNYAKDGPIETSFYPEIYLGSTFTGGDPNLYFAGGGNAYQMGFADGQTYTIHASETYNNVFTIFTPAFRAVADFFNLNIGPFKVWYFFAIPLIITLLILVLRLVKH